MSSSAAMTCTMVAPVEPEFVGYEPGPTSVRDAVAHQLRAEHRQLQEVEKRVAGQGVMVTALLINLAVDAVLDAVADLGGRDEPVGVAARRDVQVITGRAGPGRAGASRARDAQDGDADLLRPEGLDRARRTPRFGGAARSQGPLLRRDGRAAPPRRVPRRDRRRAADVRSAGQGRGRENADA